MVAEACAVGEGSVTLSLRPTTIRNPLALTTIVKLTGVFCLRIPIPRAGQRNVDFNLLLKIGDSVLLLLFILRRDLPKRVNRSST